MKKIGLIIAPVIALSGCAGIEYNKKAGLAKVSNAERTFVVDYGDRKGTVDPIKRCLEAPGPAALLQDRSFDTKLKGDTTSVAEAEINFLLKNTESVASLYEVSSILQYAHAMSYRLCEAALNQYIDGPTYAKKLSELMASTQKLLEYKLKTAEANKDKAIAEKEKAKAEATSK
tara:strand:+ start:1882 stop:2403 length:522 start_codon:yes stop_codon:yes gene_type:complete